VQIPPAEIDPAVAEVQVPALAGKARIDASKGEITVIVPLDKDEADKLVSCVKSPEAKAKVAEAVEVVRQAEKAFGGTGKTRVPSPWERQLDFIVPLLCVRENGQLFEFELTFLIEHPWKLSAKDAALADGYNPLIRPAGKAGLLDVGAKGEVQTTFLQDAPDADFVGTLHQQVMALGSAGDWSVETLVAWLDKQIDHQDIPLGESAEFLRKVIRGLMAKCGIADVSVLALDRFRLRDEVETRIQQHRAGERRTAFQGFLLPESPLAVSEERTINFKTMSYEPGWLYEGGFQFKNHYFGPKPGELKETTPNGNLTEEFKCAQYLDGLPEVSFWVRNLARRNTSFRLQTSTDWCYPDFLCQHKDGRVLAVEYKGKHLYEATDAEEKRAVGKVWESRSGGKCLFVMPTEGDFSVIAKAIKHR
jgi:type III restriction enzyme